MEWLIRSLLTLAWLLTSATILCHKRKKEFVPGASAHAINRRFIVEADGQVGKTIGQRCYLLRFHVANPNARPNISLLDVCSGVANAQTVPKPCYPKVACRGIRVPPGHAMEGTKIEIVALWGGSACLGQLGIVRDAVNGAVYAQC